jgi:hypothetical protein
MLKTRQTNNIESWNHREGFLIPADSSTLARSIGGQGGLIVPGGTLIFTTTGLPPKVTSVVGIAAGASGIGGLGMIGTQFFDPTTGKPLDLTQTAPPPPKITK